MSLVHSDAVGVSVPTEREEWTVGQHPAMSSGWIVRPVLFGSRVRVLPECEGGHVVIKSERDARLIAAAPDLFRAASAFIEAEDDLIATLKAEGRHTDILKFDFPHMRALRAAVAKAGVNPTPATIQEER